MKDLPISTFKNDPVHWADTAKKEGPCFLTKHDQRIAVLLSVETFQSMEEMIRISGNIELLKRIYGIQDEIDQMKSTEHLAIFV